jgi:hypothetical protein
VCITILLVKIKFSYVYALFQLSLGKNLPDNICNKCYKLLPEYLKFHKKCLASQRQLQEIKLSVKEEDPEIIEPKVECGAVKDLPEIIEIFIPLPNEEDGDDKDLIPKIEIAAVKDDPEDKVEKYTPTPAIAEPNVKKIYRRKAQQCTVCGKVVKRLDGKNNTHPG